ncbi:PREDICTED: NAC [Prunus dulcis]|uniref:PREDICTED: NAC n=1 Tax=Prunus dulcis TaxID=3755 RepID=A0A5E4E999_PRUDU|nr:PREDICTED: NAC [Prunus dulcis]
MRTNLQSGYWRAKGEACRIFSNSSMTGWRAIIEFYQGQSPHESKTNWVMQEYWITQKKNQTRFMPEIDYVSRGDYLELLDLDTPASFSFSSDSSCLTMSSDECFDSLALLEELEPKNSPYLVNNNAGCKFSISAPLRADELVMFAASSGSFSKSPSEERIRTHSPIHGAVCGKISGRTSNNMSRIQKPEYRNEGGPSTFHNVAVSLSSHTASPEGKRRARIVGRTKKLKK